MGIISKIYSGVSTAITTDQGKVITGFAYGVGASIVIIGALFKILHLPGAEEMLMVGMGAEAFLFALGAFEPPHKEYDWSVIYPELAYSHGHGHTPAEDANVEAPAVMKSTNANSSVSSNDLAGLGELLSPADLEKLKDGLKKLGDTASKMNDISGASIATENYIKNMEKAAVSVDHFSDVQEKGTEAVKQATETFGETYKKVVDTFESSLTDAYKGSTNSLKDAAAQLQSAYSNSSKALEKSVADLGSDATQISSTLNSVSSNLSKVNSVYELQLQVINQQLEVSKNKVVESQKINSNLSSISTNYAESVKDSEAYKNEATKLKKQITDLNSIYGNMLNALNIES